MMAETMRILQRWLLALACVTCGSSFLLAEQKNAPDSGKSQAEQELEKNSVDSENNVRKQSEAEKQTQATKQLEFSFDRVPWRDVLNWLAEESKLALHVAELPTGTFTYVSDTEYTPAQALDRINLFLIPEGFALVRSKDLLSVIGLSDERSLQKLDAMATLIDASELDQREDHEVVKCLLDLNDVTPSAAASEIRQIKLFVEPVVLSDSQQLLMTGTAKQLRSVRAVLGVMQAAAESRKPSVEAFHLEHIRLTDFLDLAGTHLGIAPGRTSNEHMSISTDETGTELLVSGKTEALELLGLLINKLDTEKNAEPQRPLDHVLRSHSVKDENLAQVFEVLQTVLVDRPIRLSMEASTNSIIALANEEEHKIIENTIEELKGEDVEFQIVQLQRMDPYQAITLLSEMFNIADPSSRRPTDLKLDADPQKRQLFIRGPSQRVAELREAIERLDNPDPSTSNRVVPVFGSKANRLLEEAVESWIGTPVQHTAATTVAVNVHERVVGDATPTADVPATDRSDTQARRRRIGLVSTTNKLHANANDPSPPSSGSTLASGLKAEITDEGIVIESKNATELSNFEAHLRRLADKDKQKVVDTVVYYLKYSEADDAIRMLADMLDASTSLLNESSAATLVNSSVASRSTAALGRYLDANDGAAVVSTKTLSIIADARLNRLICVGGPEDLALVDQYLKVIDKENGLTSIKTKGSAHIIELKNSKPERMIELLRDAYGDRVAMDNRERTRLQERIASSRDRNATEEGLKLLASQSKQAQMNLAVHEPSNAIIVTAPEALYEEVEVLVKKLDAQGASGAEAVEVLWYPGAELRLESLRDMLGQQRRGR